MDESIVLDVTEEEVLLRYSIGDVEVPYELPSPLLILALEKHPEATQTIRVWKASIQCLKWLKAKFATQASRRREREGGREVEEYRAEKYKAISDLLKWTEENPPNEDGTTGWALPVFGGTMLDQSLVNKPGYVPANTRVGWFYNHETYYGEDY